MIIKHNFMLQAATLKRLAKKKQLLSMKSEQRDDEGCDPDIDRSFTLTALDHQSFMSKITLQIVPAAISHVDTRWNAAANKGTIIF